MCDKAQDRFPSIWSDGRRIARQAVTPLKSPFTAGAAARGKSLAKLISKPIGRSLWCTLTTWTQATFQSVEDGENLAGAIRAKGNMHYRIALTAAANNASAEVSVLSQWPAIGAVVFHARFQIPVIVRHQVPCSSIAHSEIRTLAEGQCAPPGVCDLVAQR
jgi:hypothetical protein